MQKCKIITLILIITIIQLVHALDDQTIIPSTGDEETVVDYLADEELFFIGQIQEEEEEEEEDEDGSLGIGDITRDLIVETEKEWYLNTSTNLTIRFYKNNILYTPKNISIKYDKSALILYNLSEKNMTFTSIFFVKPNAIPTNYTILIKGDGLSKDIEIKIKKKPKIDQSTITFLLIGGLIIVGLGSLIIVAMIIEKKKKPLNLPKKPLNLREKPLNLMKNP